MITQQFWCIELQIFKVNKMLLATTDWIITIIIDYLFIYCNWWLAHAKCITFQDFKYDMIRNICRISRWILSNYTEIVNIISIKLKSNLTDLLTPWRIQITTVTAHQSHIYMENNSWFGIRWRCNSVSKHSWFSRARFACNLWSDFPIYR